MARPTLLVAEPEPEQAFSRRRLVLETGKFNVLTVHSGRKCKGADRAISSHQPEALLEVTREMFGDPRNVR